MPKTPRTVPVFLIYAGIIHLIGLALLLPMIVTLPGSLDRVPPRASVIDVKVEIVPDGTAPGEADTTAALPKPSEASGAEAAAGAAAAPAAEASPETAPAGEGEPKPPVDEDEEKDTPKPVPAAVPEPDKTEADAKNEAEVETGAVKKSIRRAKTVARRSARSETKIAPFNGALSGVFAPAPTRKPRFGF